MASITNLRTTALELTNTIGKSALSALYPQDIEVYLCSLELATSKGEIIDFFTFPVMPDSISKTEVKRTTLKNTASGITVLSSPTFTPSEINIRGNFGKYFKVLLSDVDPSGGGVAYSIKNGKYDLSDIGKAKLPGLSTSFFDLNVKTGYGAIKILKAIVSKSNGLDDDGKPFKLFFYNYAFGESYLVVIPPSGITFSQNLNKNMIWEYNLTMVAIAPLEAVKNEISGSSLVKKLAISVVQKSVNTLASKVKSILS